MDGVSDRAIRAWRTGLVGGVCGMAAAAVLGLSLGLGPSGSDGGSSSQPAGIVDGRVPDTASLKVLLESLGYEPEDIGQNNWRVKRTRGQWELGIDVQVNAVATTVWVRCFIGTLSEAEGYETKHYLGLLEMQGRVSPRFFFTTPVEGGLGLFYCRGLDNRALTAEIVESEIAAIQETLAENVALWNYTEWKRSGAGSGGEASPGRQRGR